MASKALLLAIGSLIIALIALGSVFTAVSQLRSDLAEIRRSISDIQESVSSVPSMESIEELSSEIELLKRNLEKTPTSEDIADIVAKFAEIREKVDDLASLVETLDSNLSGASETITELMVQIETLYKELEEVRDKLNSLEDLIKFPVSIVDGTGDEVIIPSKPDSIVSLAPSVTEILYYVGALNNIVAVDSFSDYPPEIVELRERGEILDVGGVYDTNLEAIIGLNPDLVIGIAASPHTRYKDILQAYGIPVLLLPEKSVNDIKRSIIMVGMATGNLDKAIDVAIEFESVVSRIKEASLTVDTVKVAWIVWIEPIFIAGGETFQGDLLYLVGGINAFENVTGWQSISPEALLEVNPDIIILTAYGVGVESFISYMEKQLGDSIYAVNAISNNRVFCINGTYSDILSRPSPRIAEGLKLLLFILHPQIYGLDYSDIPQCISPETLQEIPEPPLPLEVSR